MDNETISAQCLSNTSQQVGLGLLANLTPYTVGMGTVATLVIISTASGNALVCIAIAREKRLQSTTNFFLLSLAVNDFMTAVLVMPFGLLALVSGRFTPSRTISIVYLTGEILLLTCSILHLCTLSVDRYLSLRFPIKYGRNKMKRHLVIKICLIWMTAALLASSTSIVQTVFDGTFETVGLYILENRLFYSVRITISLYIPEIVMMVAYFLTRRILMENFARNKSFKNLSNCREEMKRERSVFYIDSRGFKENATAEVEPGRLEVTSSTVTSSSTVSADDSQCSTTLNAGRCRQHRRRGSNVKATKVLSIVIVTWAALWTPYLLFSIAVISIPNFQQMVPPEVVDIVFWFAYASFAANPVICTIFNPMFRQTFVKLLNFKLT